MLKNPVKLQTDLQLPNVLSTTAFLTRNTKYSPMVTVSFHVVYIMFCVYYSTSWVQMFTKTKNNYSRNTIFIWLHIIQFEICCIFFLLYFQYCVPRFNFSFMLPILKGFSVFVLPKSISIRVSSERPHVKEKRFVA